MKTLHFRNTARRRSVADVLSRLDLVRHGNGQLRVDGAHADEATMLRPGAAVTVDVLPRRHTPKSCRVVAEGPDWIVIDKPGGLPTHGDGGVASVRSILCAQLGLTEVWPAHRLDSDATGALLVALDSLAAARLSEAFAQRLVTKGYRAQVPTLPWSCGMLRAKVGGKKAQTEFHSLAPHATDQRIADVWLVPHTGRRHQLRHHLSQCGHTILGDLQYGGVAIDGHLRLQSARLRYEKEGIDVELDKPSWWHEGERAFAANSEPHSAVVSHATFRALRNGHPWVLVDSETRGIDGLPPGSLVDLRAAPDGRPAGKALVEGTLTPVSHGRKQIAARIWWQGRGTGPDLGSRVRAAVERRREWFDDDSTTAYRLIHGEGDQLPGFHVDRLGPVLRVILRSPAAVARSDELVTALVAACGDLPPAAIVRVVHLDHCPPGELRSVELVTGQVDGPFFVKERGLRFEVDVGLDEPERPRPGVGLFVDQRANRERLCRTPTGHWLNLFAHTGAFSTALLAGGAAHVTSVDLSQPYLDWLDRNLEANDIDLARHTASRRDVRRFLARLDEKERFTGIVFDPPTAAAAGRKFWSIRRQGAELIGQCLRRLEPGGQLLACRNDRRGRGHLKQLVNDVARDVGVSLYRIDDAGAGMDFPSLPGFTEGDPFEGIIATRSH